MHGDTEVHIIQATVVIGIGHAKDGAQQLQGEGGGIVHSKIGRGGVGRGMCDGVLLQIA